jgi:hypothetical protein
MENNCKLNINRVEFNWIFFLIIFIVIFLSRHRYRFGDWRLIKIWFLLLLIKFNGLILLYCLTYTSFSRVSGAYDHKMQKGKVLDFWKSYARDNRLIAPESTNWVRSLAPRCRLGSSTWMQESWRVRLFVD